MQEYEKKITEYLRQWKEGLISERECCAAIMHAGIETYDFLPKDENQEET